VYEQTISSKNEGRMKQMCRSFLSSYEKSFKDSTLLFSIRKLFAFHITDLRPFKCCLLTEFSNKCADSQSLAVKHILHFTLLPVLELTGTMPHHKSSAYGRIPISLSLQIKLESIALRYDFLQAEFLIHLHSG